MSEPSRRAIVLGALAAACSRKMIAAPAPAASIRHDDPDSSMAIDEIEWTLEGTPQRAVVLVPHDAKGKLPLLIALHGRGEAVKGPVIGAWGWPRDYALSSAFKRCYAPPLGTDDFEGLVEPAHLSEMNTRLATRPFGGLVVLCPYLPDLDLRKDREVMDYGAWLVNVVLPRARRELPALSDATSTGLDGVSLGAHVALRVGLSMPSVFGAVGTLQVAIGADRIDELRNLAVSARAARPSMPLRLTTSKDDVYLAYIRMLSAAWKKAGIAHDYAELPGPHDYIFNRGPGAYEMLLWHDSVLARA